MSIRFKFRSAASYDAVEIGEQRVSISVRELKAKIIRHKNLSLCQDFDLLFSDAFSGQEYNDDNYQIPSGSSVIIKRVPAGMAPKAMVPVDKVESFTHKDLKRRDPDSGILDDFDDFGADLCPLPEATFPGFDIESDKKTSRSNEEADLAGCRSGLQKLESDISQAISKETGTAHKASKGDLPQRPIVEEHIKLEKFKNLATQNTDFPLELKCSLCNKTFEDAVMIPCCQHSFCEKCIRRVLVEKGRCPKCSSSASKVEDLLPNLSLRQAIEHLIESQMLNDGSGNDLCKYVPDGESGIQAIDVSCAVKVVQREPELPHSPTATGKGSNQILSESFYESLFRKNNSFGLSNYHVSNFARGKALNSTLPMEAKQNDRGRGRRSQNLNKETGCEDLAPVADFPVPNQLLPLVQDEADSNVKKRRDTWVEGGGGDRRLLSAGRHNKGDRTCYMCGSPDHFIRDCPVASNAHPMLQTGNCPQGAGMPCYTSPYWNGTTMPPFGSFGNMYGNAGMIPYNTSMAPPFAVPPYVPAMYSGYPVPRGNMGMGSLAPLVGKGAERPHGYSQYIELQHPEKKMKLSNEHLDRGRHSNDEDDFHRHYHFNEAARRDEYKFHRKQEPSESYSHDSSDQRSRKKHKQEKYSDSGSLACDERHEKSSHSSFAGRDRRQYPPERFKLETEHKHRKSYRHGEEERIKPPGRSSKKQHERSGQSGSDSSWDHHQSRKELRRVEHDVRGSHHKHNSYLEPSKHGDKRSKDKERDSGHDSQRSKHSSKRTSDELQDDRWQLVSGLDEDRRDNYHHRKRKTAQ